MVARILALLLVVTGVSVADIQFNNGGYDNIVVTIGDNVPVSNCRLLLEHLESSLTNASQLLYTSLDGRAYFNSITVLLPDTWPSNCTTRPITGYDRLKTDIKLGVSHPVFGDNPWTQQSGGCGVQGDFIALSYKKLDGSNALSGLLIQEWAKYRYGVFDETGYKGDVVYPICYQAESLDHLVTGCSDLHIQDMGVCNGENESYNNSQLVHSEATTSLMFASQVGKFCDVETHDRYAPTKHNFMCRRQSVMEVILQHPDFNGKSLELTSSVDTIPFIAYKRRTSTRVVLVIEETQAMLIRESWSYLRAAVRKFAVLDLPKYSELGLVLANDTNANIGKGLSVLKTPAERDLVAASIPYLPGDSHGSGCIHCALSQAVQMLDDRTTTNGPSTSVIIIISPGYVPSKSMDKIIDRIVKQGVYIATINYPDITRNTVLDSLASTTGGLAFTVQEQRYNMAGSYLTTYFQLANTLFNIASHFSTAQGMPIEVHRREFWDESRSSITGSFVLEESLSEPARFTVFTHNTENPLIRGMSLVSPSQIAYSTRSDSMLSLKLLPIIASINETGTWTYTIDRFPGNPQPHFVQVLASPRSRYASVVQANAWVDGRVLRVYVHKGDFPVLGARVEVVAVKVGSNSTVPKPKFDLLDTGSGDPDVTKGDGVYSRYFLPKAGAGTYSFEIRVSDNSNTAYSYQDQALSFAEHHLKTTSCCGSNIPNPTVRPISPFTRLLPVLTATFGLDAVEVGRIGNLKVEILTEQLKARLVFTAPDPQAKRYEVRYAKTLNDIVDNLHDSKIWEHGSPFPLDGGSDSTFTLDFTRNPSLLDKPLYFCIEAFGSEDTNINNVIGDNSVVSHAYKCSNWVRVLVPSPPPPPSLATDYPYSEDPNYPSHAVVPSIAGAADYGLELILPVAGGILLLAICIAVYCYICVRRRGDNKKKKEKTVSAQQTSIQIVPSSPASNGNSVPQHFEPNIQDDEKKRSSVSPVHYDEKLVDDPIATITPIRQRTLSPYQSWTASQLLHEHERRQSPYGEISGNPNLTYDQHYNASVYGDNQSVQHYYMEQSLRNQYNEQHNPPPVPPLPALNNSMHGIYTTGPIYGVQPGTFAANGYHRNGSLMQFNPSVQGSLSSVSSGDKKKRNVTMV